MEALVFVDGFGEAHEVDTEFLIFLAVMIQFLEEIFAGDDAVAQFLREVLGGVGEAEEGQEEAADGQLELGRGTAGQVEDDQCYQNDHSKGYVMRLFQHCYQYPWPEPLGARPLQMWGKR